MQFQFYLDRLTEKLGEHQISCNSEWKRASSIIREDVVHYAIMKHVICRIYKSNNCTKGTDEIQINYILDALGEYQYELQQQGSPDIEVLQLLNTIGETSIKIFSDYQYDLIDERFNTKQ